MLIISSLRFVDAVTVVICYKMWLISDITME